MSLSGLPMRAMPLCRSGRWGCRLLAEVPRAVKVAGRQVILELGHEVAVFLGCLGMAGLLEENEDGDEAHDRRGSMMYHPPERSSSKMDTSRVTTTAVAMASDAPSESETEVPPRVRSWILARTRRGNCRFCALKLNARSPIAYANHRSRTGGYPPRIVHTGRQAPMPNISQ